uniref:(northern house mosquito) hypothetical protein n=1 Tax=Culex pipiens TaxID=7175 RepID=A0A8D8N340_CULPI
MSVISQSSANRQKGVVAKYTPAGVNIDQLQNSGTINGRLQEVSYKHCLFVCTLVPIRPTVHSSKNLPHFLLGSTPHRSPTRRADVHCTQRTTTTTMNSHWPREEHFFNSFVWPDPDRVIEQNL